MWICISLSISEDDKFKDDEKISSEFIEYWHIYACKKFRVFEGHNDPNAPNDPSTFKPGMNIRRGAVAKIICMAKYGDDCNK